MPRTTCHMSMSIDGFGAGPQQSRAHPVGLGGLKLHEWHWHAGEPGHEADAGARDELLKRRGAYVMGRNMFGPIRSDWDEDWRGWWGPEPPYHQPVFVLTHHAHDPIEMAGGTTFFFVTDGIESALEQAVGGGGGGAGGQDVRLGGGPGTIREYLRAGLVDELHVAVVPLLLGGGERLLDDLDGAEALLECVEFAASPSAAHVRLVKRASS